MPHAHGHHNHSTRGEGKEAAATAVVGCVPACCESRVVWALAGDGRAWDARFCDIFGRLRTQMPKCIKTAKKNVIRNLLKSENAA